LVWRAYYLIKKDNYLKISTLLICIFSVFAIILNIEGTNCIVQINSLPIFSNSSDEDKEVGNNSDFINQGAEVEEQKGNEPQQQQKDANTQSQEALMEQSYELRKYCFLVTNLYVYSLFGIIIGFIILVLWYIRYKKIWSWKKNGPIN
jgi:predicted PurR-regulated permease PerM